MRNSVPSEEHRADAARLAHKSSTSRRDILPRSETQDPSVKSISERSTFGYPTDRWSGSTAEAAHGSAGLELRRFRLLDLYATDTDI
jgi:hypothetical protein